VETVINPALCKQVDYTVGCKAVILLLSDLMEHGIKSGQ
jgi:hypothetical protein